MVVPMTKTGILNELATKRAELDEALKQVPEARLTLPGAAGLWSVKDIIAHITYHERWMADRIEEITRGEVYRWSEMDQMDATMRNFLEYQQFRDKPMAQVLVESRRAYQDLAATLRALDEAALFAPRRFRGERKPVVLHDLLRGKVIDHYAEHLASLRRMANG